jgi:hypothetical protein
VYVDALSPECRPEAWHKDRKQMFRKCGAIKIFENDSNKSKFDSGGN